MSKMIEITAKRDGHRRAGMAHSATPTQHEAGVFDEDQLQMLMDDPQLVVREIEAAEPKAPPAPAPKAPEPNAVNNGGYQTGGNNGGENSDPLAGKSFEEAQDIVEKATGTRPNSWAKLKQAMAEHLAKDKTDGE